MTSKEAKYILNEYRNRNYNSANKDGVALAMAIDTVLPKYVELEAHDTPMKVINDTTINGVCLDYECPSCKQEIDTIRYSKDQYYLIKHCISCGQRLDWSE